MVQIYIRKSLRSSASGGNTGGHTVCSVIAHMMESYWRLWGPTVHMGKVMQAANCMFENLPSIEKHMVEGKSVLCYKYCLGRCHHFNCSFKHVKGAELGDRFANDLCRAVGRGVEFVTREGQRPYDTTSSHYGPSNSSGDKHKFN